MARSLPDLISDQEIAEVRAMAAVGRPIPKLILDAIAAKLQAKAASEVELGGMV